MRGGHDPHSYCPDPSAIEYTVRELQEKGFLKSETVTPKGYAALELFRVKRAIFLSAGLDLRMRPITIIMDPRNRTTSSPKCVNMV